MSDNTKNKARLNFLEVPDSKNVYNGIGAELKAARNRSEKKIDEIAQELKIPEKYLKAIEIGAFTELPGDAYVIGFLKAYSEHIGLDTQLVIEQYKIESSVNLVDKPLEFPSARDVGRLPTGKAIIVGILMIVVVFSFYVFTEDSSIEENLASNDVPTRLLERANEKNKNMSEIVKSIDNKANSVGFEREILKREQDNEASLISENKKEIDVSTSADYNVYNNLKNKSLSNQNNNFVEERINNDFYVDKLISEKKDINQDPSSINNKIEKVNRPQYSNLSLNHDNVEKNNNKKNIISNLEAGNNFGQGNKLLLSEVSVVALMDSWVQLNTSDGQILTSRLFLAGDIFELSNYQKVSISTGNAGGVILNFNGGSSKPLGKIGEILKDVPINELKIVE